MPIRVPQVKCACGSSFPLYFWGYCVSLAQLGSCACILAVKDVGKVSWSLIFNFSSGWHTLLLHNSCAGEDLKCQRRFRCLATEGWQIITMAIFPTLSVMLVFLRGFQVSQWVKNPPAMQESQKPQEPRVQSLSWEDSLEEGMAIHSSILAWRTPWSEEPGRLQSLGLQRVWHDWSNWALMQGLPDAVAIFPLTTLQWTTVLKLI